MWRQAKVTVGDVTADQAMVDFAPGRNAPATVLEWPTRLELNAEIQIGDETYFADDAQACAGKFHMPLMRELRRPKEELPPAMPEPSVATAETPTRKGKKP